MAHVPRDDCDVRISAPIKIVSETNTRGHWAKGYRRSKKQRSDLRLFLNVKRKPKLPVDVFLTRVGKQKIDQGNLEASFKAVQDEIALWLGVDDGGSEVKWHYEQRYHHKNDFGLIVEILGS